MRRRKMHLKYWWYCFVGRVSSGNGGRREAICAGKCLPRECTRAWEKCETKVTHILEQREGEREEEGGVRRRLTKYHITVDGNLAHKKCISLSLSLSWWVRSVFKVTLYILQSNWHNERTIGLFSFRALCVSLCVSDVCAFHCNCHAFSLWRRSECLFNVDTHIKDAAKCLCINVSQVEHVNVQSPASPWPVTLYTGPCNRQWVRQWVREREKCFHFLTLSWPQ